MGDQLADINSGGNILFATSYDLNHAPINVIDGKSSSYWISTGVFPQELILQFSDTSSIRKVELISTGVKYIELLKCENSQPNTWEKIGELEAGDGDGEAQRLNFPIPSRTNATYLRFKVSSSYYDKAMLSSLKFPT